MRVKHRRTSARARTACPIGRNRGIRDRSRNRGIRSRQDTTRADRDQEILMSVKVASSAGLPKLSHSEPAVAGCHQ